MVIRVSECREYLSAYNESSFLQSSFGAAKVTFCFRQIFCMPPRLRADSELSTVNYDLSTVKRQTTVLAIATPMGQANYNDDNELCLCKRCIA